MAERLSVEFVRGEFEKEGYQLLSDEYKNCNQKLEFICPEGHKHSISYDSFRRGSRCYYCFGSVTKTISEIRGSFEREGYQLLTNEYKNAHDTKLSYICPVGHRHSIGWMSWNEGKRCRLCGIKKQVAKRRLGLDKIRASFMKEGYQLLTTNYKNSEQRLEYMCPNRHWHYISWDNWKKGRRCPHCNGFVNKSLSEVMALFEKEGYTLLETEYHRSQQKLRFVCPRGHRHYTTLFVWLNRGTRCGECFREDRHGANHPMWRGGISFEPYCHIWKDKEYREYLKERDDEKFCWNPQCLGRGSVECFHHINYIKKDCDPQNIIKICNSCNSIANNNRGWWKSFYTEINRRRLA